MPFVIDASTVACWLLPDGDAPEAGRAYARIDTDAAVAPGVFWFEIRNLLLVNERRGRIDPRQTRIALALLQRLPIRFDSGTDADSLFDLARAHRLTVYDAAYLELARRAVLPLATLDAALMRAARAEGVALL